MCATCPSSATWNGSRVASNATCILGCPGTSCLSSILPNFFGTAFSSAWTTGDRSYVKGMSSVDEGSAGSVSMSAVSAGDGATISSFVSHATAASAANATARARKALR